MIDARTDAHLWAEHYDRPLDDVFAIQSEIAQSIADQLRSKLSPSVKADIAGQPTTDLKAYELYVRARAVLPWNDPDGAEKSLEAKVALLEEAVRQDPNFALAYCELAKTHEDYEEDVADGTHLILARKAAEKALSLRPGLGEARREMARYYLHAQDFSRAHDEAVAVLRALPNDSEALRLVSEASGAQEHWDEALASMEKAYALNPANYEYSYHLGAIYRSMRRYKEWEQMLLKNPATSQLGSRWVQVLLAEIRLDTGDPAAARDCLAKVPLDFAPTEEIWMTRFTATLYLRDYDAAERTIAATPKEQMADAYLGQPPLTWDNAMLARLRGDEPKAQTIFAAARQWTTTAWDEARRERTRPWLLSRCDAGTGHKEDAIREARHVCAEWPLSRNPGIAKYYMKNLALVYAQTGERALAIDQLETLAKMYDTVTYGDLRCSPYWDPLRGDPRFEALVTSLAPKP